MPATPLSADPAPEEDLLLRERLVRKERGAAEELCARHLEPLYEFVHYRLGGDRQRTEDLVQETFLTALERIEAYDGRASLHGWLCGIAKNKLRAERRKRRPRSLDDVLAAADPEIDLILAQVSREPIPEAVLERRETRELVGATLSTLPLDYRRALLAKNVEGLSVNEIARATGRSAKAAESGLTRARVAFSRVFELLAKKRGGVA
jgi:RNA polymerase sigma-70 factor (ECF subfamily)